MLDTGERVVMPSIEVVPRRFRLSSSVRQRTRAFLFFPAPGSVPFQVCNDKIFFDAAETRRERSFLEWNS